MFWKLPFLKLMFTKFPFGNCVWKVAIEEIWQKNWNLGIELPIR